MQKKTTYWKSKEH